jgi:hypothetical protein
MPRHLVQIVIAACVVILAGPISIGAAAGSAQTGAGPFDGRWVIPADVWFDQLTTASGQGRGGAGGRGGRGAQAPSQAVVLELRVAPSGAVTGRATGVSGRRGAPGSHPAHDVEIARGSLKGDTLSFQIWRFDGFHNRLHVSARIAGADLELEFRRETPAGPETFTTRARRATY